VVIRTRGYMGVGGVEFGGLSPGLVAP